MAKKLLLYTLDFLQKNPDKVNQEIQAVFNEIDQARTDKNAEVKVEINSPEPEKPGEEKPNE